MNFAAQVLPIQTEWLAKRGHDIRFGLGFIISTNEEPPMSHRKKFFLLAILSLAVCDPARAASLPTYVGACVKTRIKSIGTRLEGAPGSGSAVTFYNGGYQVGYDTVPAIEHSKAGDHV